MSRDPRKDHREGIEYVVCPECGSHVLVHECIHEWAREGDEMFGERKPLTVEIRCDNDECELEFWAEVSAP